MGNHLRSVWKYFGGNAVDGKMTTKVRLFANFVNQLISAALIYNKNKSKESPAS